MERGEMVRLTEHIIQQIVAENPYEPLRQFEPHVYDLEERGMLPQDVTAWDLVANFTRFRGEGAVRE